MAVQGSYEWLMERLGHVTTSKFETVLKEPKKIKDKKAGKLAAVAQTYLDQLMAEHITQEPSEEIHSKYLRWGEEWEPRAREAYEAAFNVVVKQVGFVRHPTELLIGGSPDGMIGDVGTMEIKCPMTKVPHLEILRSHSIPEEYVAQVQGILWVTKRQWCDFVSYQPRFPEELRLKVIRVFPDRFWQYRIENAVIPFRNELLRQLQHFVETTWQVPA